MAQIIPFNGKNEAEMLRLAACLEEHFPHSMANAVVEAARRRGLRHEERHAKVEYLVAHGRKSSTPCLRSSPSSTWQSTECSPP